MHSLLPRLPRWIGRGVYLRKTLMAGDERWHSGTSLILLRQRKKTQSLRHIASVPVLTCQSILSLQIHIWEMLLVASSRQKVSPSREVFVIFLAKARHFEVRALKLTFRLSGGWSFDHSSTVKGKVYMGSIYSSYHQIGNSYFSALSQITSPTLSFPYPGGA